MALATGANDEEEEEVLTHKKPDESTNFSGGSYTSAIYYTILTWYSTYTTFMKVMCLYSVK